MEISNVLPRYMKLFWGQKTENCLSQHKMESGQDGVTLVTSIYEVNNYQEGTLQQCSCIKLLQSPNQSSLAKNGHFARNPGHTITKETIWKVLRYRKNQAGTELQVPCLLACVVPKGATQAAGQWSPMVRLCYGPQHSTLLPCPVSCSCCCNWDNCYLPTVFKVSSRGGTHMFGTINLR